MPGTLLAFQNHVPSKTNGEENGLKFSYCNANSVRKSDTLKNCLTSNVWNHYFSLQIWNRECLGRRGSDELVNLDWGGLDDLLLPYHCPSLSVFFASLPFPVIFPFARSMLQTTCWVSYRCLVHGGGGQYGAIFQCINKLTFCEISWASKFFLLIVLEQEHSAGWPFSHTELTARRSVIRLSEPLQFSCLSFRKEALTLCVGR